MPSLYHIVLAFPVIFHGLLLGVKGQEIAQCNATTGFDWAYNSLGQSPCEVASYLGAVCNDGVFSVLPLQEGNIYVGPTAEAATPCRCSSVFYSALSACGACQDRRYQRWSRYNVNCTAVALTYFPEDIPAGTRVPHWAYLDVSADDAFNATVALADAQSNAAESSGTPRPNASSTSSGPSSSSSNTGSSSGSNSNGSSGGSNAGAIAGGVVGGVAGLGIIAAFIFWFLRRRRARNAIPPSARAAPDMVSFAASPFPNQPSTPPAKLYNPSDPSTFPSSTRTSPYDHASSPMSSMYTTAPFEPPSLNVNTTRPLTPNRNYTGAPEV